MVSAESKILHKGACHCGAITFEFKAPGIVEILDCNCSICKKVGYRHLIVPKGDFYLLTGEGLMTSYRFNTKVAEHLFCSHCGVKSFYVPRSNPDGISINFRCVDESSFENITFSQFDGQNWEAHGASLSHLT